MTSHPPETGTSMPLNDSGHGESTDTDYEAAARWAETATFDPHDPTVERGEAAAASGRALLQAAFDADEQEPTADDYDAAARWAESATIAADAKVDQARRRGQWAGAPACRSCRATGTRCGE